MQRLRTSLMLLAAGDISGEEEPSGLTILI